MEMGITAVVFSAIALGLNGLLLASYFDLKSKVRLVDLSLDETLPKVIKDLKSDYVNKNEFNETISDIKVDKIGIRSKVANLEERVYKYEDTHSIDEGIFKNIMEKSKKSVDGIGKHYYGNGFKNKDESKGKLKKYRVTFRVPYIHSIDGPLNEYRQCEVECVEGDMEMVVNFAQRVFDSHSDNAKLKRVITKIEVVQDV